MKQSFIVYTGFGLEKVWPKIQDLLGEAFAGRHSAELIVKTSDKPTDLMRKKWHAMCGDLAKQVPEYKGAKMNLDRWKAVSMAVVIEQEWLPAWDGNGVVPFRKSSENLTKKQYCDCIEVAYMIGAHFDVVWTNPKEEGEGGMTTNGKPAFAEETELCCAGCGGSGVGGVEPVCCGHPIHDECCGSPVPSPYPCQFCGGQGSITAEKTQDINQ